ncbi:MAG TPA: YitT family protein [Acholeplasmataceae bacterium]|nr:YitT family protein [Acholeplasmataceae bacterium]
METKKNFKKKIKEWLNIIGGVAMASFAFSFFLSPKNIVIGGVSGIGIILKNLISGYDPAFTILIINIFLLLLGLLLLGRDFFLKTAFGSILFPLFIGLFEFIYARIKIDVTELDMVLIVLFSALIMGVGLGIVVRNGGTTGGSEVIQKVFFRFFHMPYSVSLYIIDGLIITLGLAVGISDLQTFLYAIVFTYLSGVVVDTIVFAGFNKRAVYIISAKHEEIKNVILHNFERGVTSIKVVGEYSKNERTLLLCVLPSIEYFRLRNIVEEIDKNAFFFAVRASEVRGEGFSYD